MKFKPATYGQVKSSYKTNGANVMNIYETDNS